jgi:GNAT superfamily N-acetyltransferase
MSDVELREATTADADTILAIVHGAFEEYRGRLDPPSGAHRETPDSIRTRLEVAGAVIAALDGQPCACAFYRQEHDHVYLDRLSVLPAFRGRGVASAIVTWVESRASERGVDRVEVGVRLALPRNRSYFERLGYTVISLETHPGYDVPTGTTLAKVLSGRARDRL